MLAADSLAVLSGLIMAVLTVAESPAPSSIAASTAVTSSLE